MAKGKRNLKGASIRLLSRGWLAADVEQWIRGTLRTRDLFGLFDVLALHPDGRRLLLQVTNLANLSSHVMDALDAISDHRANLVTCLKAGMQCETWGWRPAKKLNNPILARTFKLSDDGDHVIAYAGSDILEGEEHGNVDAAEASEEASPEESDAAQGSRSPGRCGGESQRQGEAEER